MMLEKVLLTHFRNFTTETFSFSPFLTVIIGQNSVGKTNLLEAIYFLIKGKGFREEKEEELMQFGRDMCSVEGVLTTEEENIFCAVKMRRTSFLEKHFFVNKVKKKSYSYVSMLPPLVIFSPSFMYVIDGDKAKRRSFFDDIIAQTDREYKKRLTDYETALRKRNKILEKVRDHLTLKEELRFWDAYLINEAEYIVGKREEFVGYLNDHSQFDHTHFTVRYGKNVISHERLAQTFEKQLFVRKTLVGPQRDVFEICIQTEKDVEERSVHTFGSRSEQRLALFWLCVNEMRLYHEKLGKRPLLLLDDIFSELDAQNKSLIMRLIEDHQTVITTIDEEFIKHINTPKTIIQL